jgi:hypothetical protein
MNMDEDEEEDGIDMDDNLIINDDDDDEIGIENYLGLSNFPSFSLNDL